MKLLLTTCLCMFYYAVYAQDPMHEIFDKDDKDKTQADSQLKTLEDSQSPNLDEMNDIKLDLETDIADLQKQLDLLNKQSSENKEVQEIKQQVEENIRDLQRQLAQVNQQIQQHLASNSPQPQQPLMNNTAGMELQEGAKMQFAAISVAIGGALISGLLARESLGTGIAVASLAGVTSFILNITAWSHVKRAGEVLENPRLAFGVTGNGLGLALRLH